MSASSSTIVDLDAEHRRHRGDLAADEAAAEHDHARRQPVEREERAALDDPLMRGNEAGRRRGRAGGDDRPLRADRGGAVDRDRLAIRERGRARELLDAIGGQELLHPAAKLVDDLVLATDHRRIVEGRAADGDAERRGVADMGEGLGRGDQRLGRDAAEVQARPAQSLALDDGDGRAELRGANGGGIAARPRADDYDVKALHNPLSSSLFLMLLMKRAAVAPSIKR